MEATEKAMKTERDHQPLNVEEKTADTPRRRRRCAITVCGAIIVLVMVLSVIILVLALTVFKATNPKTEIVSATLDGISPIVSLPAVSIELNITLDLKILVRNKNYASFRHGEGKSLLLYKEKQVGEVAILPGNIRSRGSTTLPCRLTLEVDQFGSELVSLISDVVAGELTMDTQSRIPGKVTFLGFIKKHAVALSTCRFTISISDLKISSQVCKSKAKL